MIQIKLKKIHPQAQIPKKANPTDAGWDIFAPERIRIPPRLTTLVNTGFAVEIPEGYELQIRSKSGLAYKTHTIVAQGIGTIDSGYRGEVGVLLWNRNTIPVEIYEGQKIAQFVVGKVHDAEFMEVDELSDTSRGEGGFGSTGK